MTHTASATFGIGRSIGLALLVACGCSSAPAEPVSTRRPTAEGSAPVAPSSARGSASPLAPRCVFPGERAPCKAACDAGRDEACAVFGLLELQAGSPEAVARAVALLEKSCAAGVALGCGGLGSLHVAGIGVPRDVARGRQLFVDACGRGDGLSCESLGGLFAGREHVPADLPAAAGWYDKACELGRPAACAFFASFILDGALPEAPDRARAAPLLQKACDGEVHTACKMLGDLYAKGDTVARDAARAAQLYERACALGSQLGCRAAGR